MQRETSKQARSVQMKTTISGGLPPKTVVWWSNQSEPPHLGAHIVNRLPVGPPVGDQRSGSAQLYDKPVGLQSRTVVIGLFFALQNPALDGLVLMSPYSARWRHMKILWSPQDWAWRINIITHDSQPGPKQRQKDLHRRGCLRGNRKLVSGKRPYPRERRLWQMTTWTETQRD